MKHRLIPLLDARSTYYALLALNGLVVLTLWWSMRHDRGGDFKAYIGEAEGIMHGSFSMFWMLDHPIPDTFRTPGYPLYIACILWLFGNWKALKIVQLIMYVLIVHFVLRLIDQYDDRPRAKNCFLLLLLLSPNIPWYIPVMSPEIPVILCISVLLVRDPLWKTQTWLGAIAAGLLYGFIFQCRPIFLFFPIARVVCDIAFASQRVAWGKSAVVVLTYVATLLPFGFWNLKEHGQFRLTPLEGGGGVMHMGYWSGRIPGHAEYHYWANTAGDEMMLFVPRADVPRNVALFEREWDGIDSALAPFVSAQDSFMLFQTKRIEHAIPTYSTRYTLERERLLKGLTIAHIKEDPGYFTKYKIYSLFRLWIVGVPHDGFRTAGIIGKLSMLFAFAITLGIFLIATVVLPMAYRRGLMSLRNTYPLLLYVFYFWLTHLPFVIQTRYTIPVRMILYVLIALAISAFIGDKTKEGTAA